jgi:hypothetical protein
MIYVDRTTGLVAVKVSSWPTPQDPWKLFSTLAAFGAINAELAPHPVKRATRVESVRTATTGTITRRWT